MKAHPAFPAAERAARESYGRLLAYLSARTRDVAAAEDALAEAFRQALEEWPVRGVPANPDAWLLTAAKRRSIDQGRRRAVRREGEDRVRMAHDEAEAQVTEAGGIPDERLKLMFACAHPAIDPSISTPLMLQTVLGLDARRIASSFLVSPTTMGQRLVRAKTKLRDAGIPFGIPGRDALPQRVGAVLEAIYAAYGSAYAEEGADGARGLAEEAVWLARLTAELLPADPEAQGLLALLLHCEARRPASRDATGAFVPLSEQDPARWNRDLREEAEERLGRAHGDGPPGRFRLEAAIQSVHAERARTGAVNGEALRVLYACLVHLAPTVGAHVGRAAVELAHGGEEGAAAALRILDGLGDRVTSYQPHWAVRTRALRAIGRSEEAREALDRAIGLCTDAAVREHLTRQYADLPR